MGRMGGERKGGAGKRWKLKGTRWDGRDVHEMVDVSSFNSIEIARWMSIVTGLEMEGTRDCGGIEGRRHRRSRRGAHVISLRGAGSNFNCPRRWHAASTLS